jgi:glyoxylase-like metal-dependent hydrolase (beta-lactamase superfamily II)
MFIPKTVGGHQSPRLHSFMHTHFWSDCVPQAVRARLLAVLTALLITGLASPPAVAQQPQTRWVADNVYALVGTADTVTRKNRGRVANAGFIVGPSGVVVIDTGVSYRHGKQILAAIREVTDLPIALVILTHAVREFVFGAAAFEEAGAGIAAHSETRNLMKARCAQCLVHLVEELGAEMDGSRLVIPNVLLDDTRHIEVGGIALEVLFYGWAATPGDVAVLHRETGTLFGGGLVSAHHVPVIRDADFDGWQNTLEALLRMPVRHVVPGFGPVSDQQAIRDTAHYLHALDAHARSLYEESASLLEAVDQAHIAEFAQWHAYDPNHRRNALHRRLQLEIEDLGGDPRSFAVPDGE